MRKLPIAEIGVEMAEIGVEMAEIGGISRDSVFLKFEISIIGGLGNSRFQLCTVLKAPI